MHDIFRDGFFTASTHSALTSTITHKTSVYPAFWLPPISTCVTVSPVYLLENRTRLLRISSTLSEVFFTGASRPLLLGFGNFVVEVGHVARSCGAAQPQGGPAYSPSLWRWVARGSGPYPSAAVTDERWSRRSRGSSRVFTRSRSRSFAIPARHQPPVPWRHFEEGAFASTIHDDHHDSRFIRSRQDAQPPVPWRHTA